MRDIWTNDTATMIVRGQACTAFYRLLPNRVSTLMWTHYAASHTGFVIGFDTASELFKQAGSALRPVEYLEERQWLTRRRSPTESNEDVLYSKSLDWKYEEEWRWVECRDPSEYADLMPGPTGELLFLRPIPPDSIQQIVLGDRASPSLRESIQTLKGTQDYQHLQIFRVELHESEYRLEVKPL